VARRLGLLAAAVVVAAVGTSMVFLYVKGANDRALRDTRPQEVLVASTQVLAGTPAGDAANQGAFVRRALPRMAIADGALSNINPIQGKVALTTIFPGQQVLQQMFGEGAAAGPFASLPKGTLAVSFSFADPNRVAGFVQPGSRVAVFLTEEARDSTRVLLPRAQVVAVGPSTVSAGAGPATANPEKLSRALLTLALTQREAEKMIHAASKGTLYLGLLTDQSQVATSSGISGAKLFN
jgi:pilus assembly protein CpaB